MSENTCTASEHLGPVVCDGLDHFCNACGNWVENCPEAGTFSKDDDCVMYDGETCKVKANAQ
jgi:hypothetical protein